MSSLFIVRQAWRVERKRNRLAGAIVFMRYADD